MKDLEKLLAAIKHNPRDVRFSDASKAAEALGFTAKASSGTSHYAFARPGEPMLLNFQKGRNGKIPPYQARQLIKMIQKYGE